jgi:hypothetical protein
MPPRPFILHGNALRFVADGETDRARKVAEFEVAMKAEGLAVLGAEAGDRRPTIECSSLGSTTHCRVASSGIPAATIKSARAGLTIAH